MNLATTNIKGTDYKLMRLDPLKGGRIATRVGALLAAAANDEKGVEALINAYQAKEGEEATNPLAVVSNLPKLVTALAGGIGKIDADALYTAALECVTGNLFADKKLHDEKAMNAYFADHPDHLLLVMAWALKENCAGFFGFGGRA